jgi:hypothetical protein
MQADPHITTQLSGTAASSRVSREAALHEVLGAATDPLPAAEASPSPDTIPAGLHARAFVPQPVGISIYE